MHKTLWKAGFMAAVLLVSPMTAVAQQQQDTYYKLEVQDYPPWQPPPAAKDGQAYYRDADPEYAQKFQANVDAYKKQMQGQHHDHIYHTYTADEVKELENKARGGDKFALRALGDGYASGDGFPKNEQKALEWYEMGARLGHNEFFARVGDLYRERYTPPQSTFQKMMSYVSKDDSGAAVERDNRIALVWYERGRVWDDAASLMALSEFYKQGLGGVAKDEKAARDYHIRGVQLLQREEQRNAREFESEARRYAAKVTPFNPQEGGTAQPQAPQGGLQVIIGGKTCYYSQTQEQVSGYDFLYRAQCEGIVNPAALKEQVALPGLLCDAGQQQQGASLQLKCNAVGGEIITMAGAECSVRSETPSKGYAAVYGAYCQGDARPTRDKVVYRGFECLPNRVYTEGGKHYTLYCNPPEAQPTTAGRQAVQRDKQVTLGNFACVVAEQGAAATIRRIQYNVNCGGLTPAAKVGPQMPKLVPFGEYLCEVAPVEGRENVDFTMDCKR